MKTVYLACVGDDGPGCRIIGAFPTKNWAQQAADRHAGAYALSPDAVPFYPTLDEYLEANDDTVKKQKLLERLKLSEEEKRILGIKEGA